jgi:hypothetical protein
MLMTVTELRQYVTSDETDQVLEAQLQALELSIRAYTNNNFQVRPFRAVAVAMSGSNTLMVNTAIPFKVGDTLQITDSDLQDNALVTVEAVDGGTITVKEDLYDESAVVITKVAYPADVKMGVANMVKWELDNRDKVGVASETISRHSVTYFDMSGDNSTMGYPKAVLGFLRPYMKARFGRGIGV